MALAVFSPAMGHALAHGVTTHPGMLESMRRIQASQRCNHQRSLGEVRRSVPECESMHPSRHDRGRVFLHMVTLSIPILQTFYIGEICPIAAVAAVARLRTWDADRRHTMKRGGARGTEYRLRESTIRNHLGGVEESSWYEDEKWSRVRKRGYWSRAAGHDARSAGELDRETHWRTSEHSMPLVSVKDTFCSVQRPWPTLLTM